MTATTQTSPEHHSGGGPVRVRALHVVYAGRGGVTRSMAVLERSPIVIGREAGAGVTVVVADPEISRMHVRVEHDVVRDVWRVVDLESRNGVWLDGTRIDAADLHAGAVLRIGGSLLVASDLTTSRGPLVDEWPKLLGRSLAMQRVRGDIELVAPRTIPIVLSGETGTGKERVAEEIHRRSGRAGRFVPVNCAAIPAGLAESELFGHVAGAFTGAAARSDGLFVAAAGGTLMLDEVGELTATLQSKLLRALATGEVRSIGGADVRHVDVRVVAATHRDLDAMATAGDFRADLLARLGTWRIAIPPLRSRREDVLGLASAFLGADRRLSTNVAEALLLHDWPFNVRELENVCAALAIRSHDGIIRSEHLPPNLAARVAHRARGATEPPPLAAVVDRSRPPTRDELVRVLERCKGNLADIAEFFGKDRKQIYRWLERHGLDAASYRAD